jgi:hypothetical protein
VATIRTETGVGASPHPRPSHTPLHGVMPEPVVHYPPRAALSEAPSAPSANPAPHRFFLAPLRHTKTLYLVRHGQGFHNLYGEADIVEYRSEKYFDAHLTPKVGQLDPRLNPPRGGGGVDGAWCQRLKPKCDATRHLHNVIFWNFSSARCSRPPPRGSDLLARQEAVQTQICMWSCASRRGSAQQHRFARALTPCFQIQLAAIHQGVGSVRGAEAAPRGRQVIGAPR